MRSPSCGRCCRRDSRPAPCGRDCSPHRLCCRAACRSCRPERFRPPPTRCAERCRYGRSRRCVRGYCRHDGRRDACRLCGRCFSFPSRRRSPLYSPKHSRERFRDAADVPHCRVGRYGYLCCAARGHPCPRATNSRRPQPYYRPQTACRRANPCGRPCCGDAC